MDLLNDEMLKMMRPSPVNTASVPTSREEKIAMFNELAAKSVEVGYNFKTTLDFMKKGRDGVSSPLSYLCPVALAELEVSKIHRGRVVYCRIATRSIQSASIMVLVEDKSAIVDLAVYGADDGKDFKEGRIIAIKEPFYKIRHDGTKGIRVDDPSDIIFDPPKEASQPQTPIMSPPKRGAVEERLQEILLLTDNTKGVDKLYRQLADEGYSINKKQVRALKKTILAKASTKDSTTSGNDIVPIISERRPEKHRVLRVRKVLKYKEAGNEAFSSKSFVQADKMYSQALNNKNGPHDDSVSEVCLWQLYSNRSAARVKLGMLSEALQDSLAANMCAPLDAVKPLLRCAEAMAALGMRDEALRLLSDSDAHFPNARDLIEKKKHSITPTKVLVVGKDTEMENISDAIKIAPAGAEILVHPGIYRESLYIDKPITLRCISVADYDAIRSLEDSDGYNWAEIRAVGGHAIVFHSKTNTHLEKASHIVGFKISCDAPPDCSFHTANVLSGNVVFRNCNMTSSSGPVVCAQYSTSNIIMQGCAVHSGPQGGILAAAGAGLSLHQTHCCHNAATGLELRAGAFASLEGCHFYNNGRQGIMSWKSAGELTAKNCEIHSHPYESGVLVSEAEATFDGCIFYGNSLSGVVAQDKGMLRMFGCEVHDNCEGILIQSNGSAYVEKCKVRSNRANGIFVGFDHRGSAVLIENEVYNNRSKGVLIGSTNKKVVVRDNVEYGNLGLLPQLTSNIKAKAATVSNKFLRRARKNKAHIKKAMEESEPESFLDAMLKDGYAKHAVYEKVMENLERNYAMCALCKVPPSDKKQFAKCSRCREASYCSPKCQKSHWFEHKKVCQDQTVEYPSFLDNNVSV